MDTFNHYARKLDSLIDHYDYWKLYFAHPVSFDEDYNFEDITITLRDDRNEELGEIDEYN